MKGYVSQKLLLPSGRSVLLVANSIPDCPWEIHEAGAVFYVRRLRRGNSVEFEYFKGGAMQSMPFDRVDATALTDHMNQQALSRRPMPLNPFYRSLKS